MYKNEPSLTILGIKETNANKNKYVPHYYILHKELYPTSRLVQVSPRSVMFTREAFADLDFWSLDSDFFLMEDSLSYNDLLNYSPNHFDYFSEFLKVMRIAHSLFEDDLLAKQWSKNKAHMMDIYTAMMASEVIMLSPPLEMVFRDTLREVFSVKAVAALRQKFLVLPPPDMFKFGEYKGKKDFSKMVFLWNHRLNAVKNPKAFFGIVSEFHDRYPKIPIEVIVTSSLTEKLVFSHIPPNIQKWVTIVPFHTDPEEYRSVLLKANVTINTALIENHGISVFDAIKHQVATLNLDCNNPTFQRVIGGSESTVKRKDMVETLHRIYTDRKFRQHIVDYNMEGLRTNVVSKEGYKGRLKRKLNQVLESKLSAVAAKSPKLKTVMKKLETKPLTKREVYSLMGWKANGANPVNKFWGEYYYGLRKLGAQCSEHNGVLYYHVGQDLDLSKVRTEGPQRSKDIERTQQSKEQRKQQQAKAKGLFS
jgi:hypothetical protein